MPGVVDFGTACMRSWQRAADGKKWKVMKEMRVEGISFNST
jgi:hypothetical protein